MKKFLIFTFMVFIISACSNRDKVYYATTLNDSTLLASFDIYETPNSFDSMFNQFYQLISLGDLRLAYKYVDPKVFGSFDFFASDKGFGNIDTISLLDNQLIDYMRLTDTTVFLFFTEQINKDGSKKNYNFIINVLFDNNHFKLSSFRLVPMYIDESYTAEKLARKSFDYRPDRKTVYFPVKLRTSELGQYHLKWFGKQYIDMYIKMSWNPEQDVMVFFSYEKQGNTYKFKNFYSSLHDLHGGEIMDTVISHQNPDFDLLEWSGGGRGAGAAEYYLFYTTPDFTTIYGTNDIFAIDFGWFFSGNIEMVYDGELKDIYKRGNDIILKTSQSTMVTLYDSEAEDQTDTLTAEFEKICYYKLFPDSAKVQLIKCQGDTANILDLIDYKKIKNLIIEKRKHQ